MIVEALPELTSIESRLAMLKALPGLMNADASVGERFPFSKLPAGFPKGAVIELSGLAGCGKTELLLSFLKENPDARVAWVESEFQLYPGALAAAGARPERILFVEPPEKSSPLPILQQLLQSTAFEMVIFSPAACGHVMQELHERELRRLQLSAQKAHASLILLNSQPTHRNAWPISVQLQITRTAGPLPSIHITPLKLKKGCL